MTVVNRLIAPAYFLPILLPIVGINLVIQLLHLTGLVEYDGKRAAYIISAAYLIAAVHEAASIWRERKAGQSTKIRP
jgi:hypothetical protein